MSGYPRLWQYGLWSFKTGGMKLERFFPKNQHTQRKLLNFENWLNGKVSKSAKIWLSKSIFYVKNHGHLSQFFSLKNISLGSHFLLLTFFIISIFKSLHFLNAHYSNYKIFVISFEYSWFLAKNLSNFVSLLWKLHKRYCYKYA